MVVSGVATHSTGFTRCQLDGCRSLAAVSWRPAVLSSRAGACVQCSGIPPPFPPPGMCGAFHATCALRKVEGTPNPCKP